MSKKENRLETQLSPMISTPITWKTLAKHIYDVIFITHGLSAPLLCQPDEAQFYAKRQSLYYQRYVKYLDSHITKLLCIAVTDNNNSNKHIEFIT